MADYLISAGQEIPDGLVKITFLREAETVVRLGIADVELGTCDSILDLFLFNSLTMYLRH